ncbi:MAG TPA: rRNA maturation RNase YbeY [Anaerolineaceae bacterium]|jgi:probable rRNA maturation factor|nr:rRNA maturation RNase YbeY [Anaerolineaceae bacterium]HOR83210.1 rRNA maturation RNase YbeY [Anaerolineaceae bacterium]HPL43212.1 rRNA maturation RNase YbeY [Anaerolineaceae bacterium]HPY33042.1 rRNA maturation RNase YbeY [Anaerolineaceae bacterium]HQC20243.1 rRNA maturation RNase YbeY [Anaerolineaceae bacterium]
MLDFSIPRKYRALIDADRLTFAFQKSVEMLGLSPQTSAALKISDDASIRKLNKAYRGLDEATDVLSFENDFIDLETGARFIGDIVISIEKAQAQAAERGFSLQEELEMLLVHAVLHLNGYDHMEEADLEEMGSLQDEILIAIANPVLGSISRE